MIKKNLILTLFLNIFLFANNSKDIDLSKNNTDIKIINENINILEKKSKKYYENESNLLKPVDDIPRKASKEEDKITVDGGVDFNKSEKSIDGAKINLGTKF